MPPRSAWHYRRVLTAFTLRIAATLLGATLSAGSLRAVPGTVSGRVTDSAGHPLPRVDITIGGTTDAGTRVNFEQRTNPLGLYSLRIPSGIYRVRAYYNLVRGNASYRLPLHPLDNDDTRSYDAKPGIVKDFIWRLTGMRAFHNLNPKKPESYYGASVWLMDSDPTQAGIAGYTHLPEGTILEILLTPTGPLWDGSMSKRRTSEA